MHSQAFFEGQRLTRTLSGSINLCPGPVCGIVSVQNVFWTGESQGSGTIPALEQARVTWCLAIFVGTPEVFGPEGQRFGRDPGSLIGFWFGMGDLLNKVSQLWQRQRREGRVRMISHSHATWSQKD